MSVCDGGGSFNPTMPLHGENRFMVLGSKKLIQGASAGFIKFL
jgi:hypothetical protein